MPKGRISLHLPDDARETLARVFSEMNQTSAASAVSLWLSMTSRTMDRLMDDYKTARELNTAPRAAALAPGDLDVA